MSLNSRLYVMSVVAGLVALPSVSTATTLNFESGYVDNQVLTDNEVLLDSDGNATNVVISTVKTNTMSVEARGDEDGNPDGFVNNPIARGSERRDVESAIETESLGQYFLRSTSSMTGNFLDFNPMFTLDFIGGVSQVGAQIWDIDGSKKRGSESWDVLATFSGGLTETIKSPSFRNTRDADSLNGQAWDFEFLSDSNNIERLDFIFTGTKTFGIGVAFDNLSVSRLPERSNGNLQAAPVPLPAGGLLLLSGLVAAAGLRRRKSA